MVLSLSLQFLHKLNLFPFFFICVLIVVTIFLMIFTIHYIVQTAGNIPVKYSPADTSLSTLLSTVLEVLFSLKLSYFIHFQVTFLVLLTTAMRSPFDTLILNRSLIFCITHILTRPLSNLLQNSFITRKFFLSTPFA